MNSELKTEFPKQSQFDFELIVAISKNNIIGKNNQIPFYLPEDLIKFRKKTTNSIIIMGRKTFESLPNGPLSNRIHVVLTKTPELESKDPVYYTNLDNLFSLLQNINTENKKVFVIGGSEIYKLLFPYCQKIHLTLVDTIVKNGNTVFPFEMGSIYEKYKIENESTILVSRNNFLKYTFIELSKKMT
jgi:dihydrofolate reductase